MDLDIIYHGNGIIAVNKPPGIFTHRSKLGNEGPFALQLVRDQVGQKVYPLHRLDRKTSGVLLFTSDRDFISHFQGLLLQGKVSKSYLAVVRGFTPDTGGIDYPLRSDNGKLQEAVTCYRTLDRSELNIPSDKFETSRYSLVEVNPKSGRMHQIRKHFAHIFHPVIGDRPHGCNKQNRLFKELWNMQTMLLHAKSYQFQHPTTGEKLSIQAPLHQEFKRMIDVLSFESPEL